MSLVLKNVNYVYGEGSGHEKHALKNINIEIKERGELVTHADLLGFLEKHDEAGYRKALEKHFAVYKIFMKRRIVNE